MTIDSVSLEILGNKATAIAEEMGLTLQRSGRTIYVKETEDFGTGLFSLGGELFGYPQRTGVIGFMGLQAGEVLKAVSDLEPGDVILTNDPYTSGGLATHLPDLNLIKPYFVDDRLVCFGWCFIHSADIGGKVPSSISPTSTEIFHEGLRIPPVKFIRRGKLVDELLTVYKANCRTPDLNWGDMQAMLACLDTGEVRVKELAQQYGIETFIAAQEEILSYSQMTARAALQRIPDGRYSFTDYLDDDLVNGMPVRLKVTLNVRNGQIEVDFTGSDIEAAGPLNIATGGVRHPWLVLRLVAFARTYAPDLVLNGGIFRNMSVTLPAGSIYNPAPPAPVGIRFATGLRTYDAVNGALVQACPELLPAASSGTAVPLVLAEPGASGRSRVSVIQFMIGGTGARADADGLDGRDPGMSSMANNPIEIVESEASVSILKYGIRADSGGAGRCRGGCGQRLVFRIERDNCIILARGIERAKFQPWGLEGGQPGANFRLMRTPPSGTCEILGKIDTLHVGRGDVIEVLTPGGGGYGHPFDREAALVLADVRSGLVNVEAAARDYGVIIVDNTIDEKATRECRLSRSAVACSGGSMRAAWEALLPEAVQDELIAELNKLPVEIRRQQRQLFFERLDVRMLQTDSHITSAFVSNSSLDDVRLSLQQIGQLAAAGDHLTSYSHRSNAGPVS